MKKITINYANIKRLVELNLFQDNLGNEKDFFVGIRGAVPKDTDSWRNLKSSVELTIKPVDYLHYSCTIIQVHNAKLAAFRATTLPGKHYVDTPLNPKGAARLLQGRHVFRQGYHKASDVNKRYPAFRQNDTFPLLRDTNKNLKFDWDDSDFLSFAKSAGINIHYGTGTKIGKWSAGCNVINTDSALEKWNTFRTRVYTGKPDTSKNHVFYLFNADYVMDFIKAKSSDNWKSFRLLWGSSGKYVKSLQKEFLVLGYDVGAADGDFGPNTMRKGVMKYREINFDADSVNCIVDLAMWNHLFSDDALPNE